MRFFDEPTADCRLYNRPRCLCRQWPLTDNQGRFPASGHHYYWHLHGIKRARRCSATFDIESTATYPPTLTLFFFSIPTSQMGVLYNTRYALSALTALTSAVMVGLLAYSIHENPSARESPLRLCFVCPINVPSQVFTWASLYPAISSPSSSPQGSPSCPVLAQEVTLIH